MRWVDNFKIWRNNWRLARASRLIRKAADHPVGFIGRSHKTGTVYRCKDIHYSIRKNRLEYKYVKMSRGVRTNKYLKDGHTADQG